MPQDLSLKNMLAPAPVQPPVVNEFIPPAKPTLTPQEIAEAQMIYQGAQKAPAGAPPAPKPTSGWGAL